MLFTSKEIDRILNPVIEPPKTLKEKMPPREDQSRGITWHITHNKDTYIVSDLAGFARDHNLNINGIYTAHRKGKPYKGYFVKVEKSTRLVKVQRSSRATVKTQNSPILTYDLPSSITSSLR